ncbi:MAG: hypothetical protein VB101_05110 [Rhodospirillaceae bacterium]|nr:hypothetical protein [Rhodospirillaceae bacterium]
MKRACHALLGLLSAVFCLMALPAHAQNPFGVMLWGQAGEDTTALLARARGLGVAWYRPPALFLDRWIPGQPCPACAIYADSGLKIALTVRNSGSDHGSRAPSRPPIDIALFGKVLGSVLDDWKPAYLVVENEEDNPLSYDDPNRDFSGYRNELTRACQVAHARGILCANGGLSFESVTLAAWLDKLEHEGGEAGCAFIRRLFPDGPRRGMADALCRYETPAQALPIAQGPARAAMTLLPIYRQSPIDAVNIHWYGKDAYALSDVVAFMRRATGKPVLSNEIGQRPNEASPANIRPILRAAMSSGLTMAIWYSVDTGGSESLFDIKGLLRPSGWEFQRQMSGRR